MISIFLNFCHVLSTENLNFATKYQLGGFGGLKAFVVYISVYQCIRCLKTENNLPLNVTAI